MPCPGSEAGDAESACEVAPFAAVARDTLRVFAILQSASQASAANGKFAQSAVASRLAVM